MLSRLTSVLVSWPLLALLGSACGGNTSQNATGGAGGSSTTMGGAGGSSTITGGAGVTTGGRSTSGGNAASMGGRTTTGGASSGGETQGGTSSGGNASGGGGTLPERCQLPLTSGPCNAYFIKYGHDPATGVCSPFVYGGCGGNDNQFDSLEACQMACHGGTPNLDACETSLDCALTTPACCGPCEPLTAQDFLAVKESAVGEVKGTCTVLCGACPDPVPGTTPTRDYFVAACVNNECTVVDLRQTPATECRVDSDCSLRLKANCCEACSGEPIAISSASYISELLECSKRGPIACPPCEPIIPEGYSAACVDDRCVARPPG